MEFYLNEPNPEIVEKYMRLYPLDGITTNPKMIGSLGRIPYADTLHHLRAAVGNKKLFTQVTAEDYDGILQEAAYICSIAGLDTYIKVPANEVGIRALRTLHEQGYKTLGTLCFTAIQAVMALQVGADYVAVLYNYIEEAGYDASKTMKDIAAYVRESGCHGKLMGVGVRKPEQFGDCLFCGCQAINLNADNISAWMENAPSVRTTRDFLSGWEATWGKDVKIKDFFPSKNTIQESPSNK